MTGYLYLEGLLTPSAKGTLKTLSFSSLVWQIVSTLTTESSSASGIYYCVASNKIGTEKRSIKFYVSGKQQTLQMMDTLPTLSFYTAEHLLWHLFLSIKFCPTLRQCFPTEVKGVCASKQGQYRDLIQSHQSQCKSFC